MPFTNPGSSAPESTIQKTQKAYKKSSHEPSVLGAREYYTAARALARRRLHAGRRERACTRARESERTREEGGREGGWEGVKETYYRKGVKETY
jgi:hypothetical protein